MEETNDNNENDQNNSEWVYKENTSSFLNLVEKLSAIEKEEYNNS